MDKKNRKETKKFNEIVDKLEHLLSKILRCLEQEIGIESFRFQASNLICFRKTTSMCDCRTLYVGAKYTCVTTGTTFGICCVLGRVCFWFVGLCVAGLKTQGVCTSSDGLAERFATSSQISCLCLFTARGLICSKSRAATKCVFHKLVGVAVINAYNWPFLRTTAARQKYRIRIPWCHVPVKHVDMCR
jgi:hypothetical protein